MVKTNIKPILGPGLDPVNTRTISDELYCISDTIKVLATMVDRYGNIPRIMHGFQSRAHRDKRRLDGGEGSEFEAGWTIDGTRYPEIAPRAVAYGPARANEVVTRPPGYVPYQSVFSPFGDHAYQPGARQYPQLRQDEIASGRMAETPRDRFRAQQSWPPILTQNLNRSVEMRVEGIDYRSAPQPVQQRPVPTGHYMPPPPRPDGTRPDGTVPGGPNVGRPDYGYLGSQRGGGGYW
jgi:hypothetical protein